MFLDHCTNKMDDKILFLLGILLSVAKQFIAASIQAGLALMALL